MSFDPRRSRQGAPTVTVNAIICVYRRIKKLEDADRLYLVVSKFAGLDLHPAQVDNITMRLIFEDLIRRLNEAAKETAGDHFTPREVIRLMANRLLEPDSHILTTPGIIATVCDPACGAGGMLAEAQNWIREHSPRSYAIAALDLLIKGHKDTRIAFGNTLTDDRFPGLCSTTCSPTRPLASTGRPSRRRSPSRAASAGTSASCPASTTGRSCSCCT